MQVAIREPPLNYRERGGGLSPGQNIFFFAQYFGSRTCFGTKYIQTKFNSLSQSKKCCGQLSRAFFLSFQIWARESEVEKFVLQKFRL